MLLPRFHVDDVHSPVVIRAQASRAPTTTKACSY